MAMVAIVSVVIKAGDGTLHDPGLHDNLRVPVRYTAVFHGRSDSGKSDLIRALYATGVQLPYLLDTAALDELRSEAVLCGLDNAVADVVALTRAGAPLKRIYLVVTSAADTGVAAQLRVLARAYGGVAARTVRVVVPTRDDGDDCLVRDYLNVFGEVLGADRILLATPADVGADIDRGEHDPVLVPCGIRVADTFQAMGAAATRASHVFAAAQRRLAAAHSHQVQRMGQYEVLRARYAAHRREVAVLKGELKRRHEQLAAVLGQQSVDGAVLDRVLGQLPDPPDTVLAHIRHVRDAGPDGAPGSYAALCTYTTALDRAWAETAARPLEVGASPTGTWCSRTSLLSFWAPPSANNILWFYLPLLERHARRVAAPAEIDLLQSHIKTLQVGLERAVVIEHDLQERTRDMLGVLDTSFAQLRRLERAVNDSARRLSDLQRQCLDFVN